ncbi:MAG: TldD/PmbA family protein [Candidatus Methanofastidiosia archaeon]|jgi:TldD protein
MFRILEKGITQGEQHGADYVELRAEDIALTMIGYADGRIDNLNGKVQTGVACRVLYNGAWGFSSGTVENVETLVKKACGLAKAASENRKQKIQLQKIDCVSDDVAMKYTHPPSEVSFEEKISRLDKLYSLIKDYDKRISAVSLKYNDSHGHKYLLTNEGTRITQETGHVWNYCWVTGKGDGILTAARDGVGSSEKGFEYFEEETTQKIAERIGRRVILQIEGKTPKNGSFPCVLGPRVVGVLAHEALGHLAEADLTLNSSFNGKLGKKVAADHVTMVDEPIPGTFGALKYDDEGVPMQRVEIIKDGVFTGLLTDREYAHRTGLPVTGSARAESFLFPTLIRMRNTFFEKGSYAEDEIFEGIDFGYYCVDYRGGQAQLNSSFQVGIQEAFEIRDGEVKDPIKDLSISGIATEALFLIEGLSKKMGFEEGHCGKGQTAPISSGGPHTRVKEGGILFGGR